MRRHVLRLLVLFVGVTPAAAQQGWYLVSPPALLDWPFLDTEVALSRWTLLGAYTTADACERKRRDLAAEAKKYAKDAARAQADWRERARVRPELLRPAVRHAAFSHVQCVAVTDPRLAETPGRWVLRVPPMRATQPFVDTDAPLERWTELGAYDSRLQCEIDRSRLPEQMRLGPAPGPPDADPRWLRGPDDQFWQRLAVDRSRCVPAEDPPLR